MSEDNENNENSVNKENNSFIAGIIVIFFIIFLVVLLFASKKTKENQPEEPAPSPTPAIESVPVENIPEVVLPPEKNYKYTYTYEFIVSEHVNNFNFEIMIPDSEEDKQTISNFTIEPKPSELVSEGGNLVAKYNKPVLSAGMYKIVQSGNAKIRTYNINTAKKINKNSSIESSLATYLRPEKGIESNDPYIISIANKIKGNNKEQIIENTYRYIKDNMQYKISDETGVSAKAALQRGYGKCSDNSAVMTAILRAKNIPSRVVVGNIARESNTPHNWVEVYFDEYGWVTYDPTIEPTVLKIYGPDKKLVKTEKHYDISHDEVRYIQSAINKFNTYKLGYSTDGRGNGSIQIKYNVEIKPAE